MSSRITPEFSARIAQIVQEFQGHTADSSTRTGNSSDIVGCSATATGGDGMTGGGSYASGLGGFGPERTDGGPFSTYPSVGGNGLGSTDEGTGTGGASSKLLADLGAVFQDLGLGGGSSDLGGSSLLGGSSDLGGSSLLGGSSGLGGSVTGSIDGTTHITPGTDGPQYPADKQQVLQDLHGNPQALTGDISRAFGTYVDSHLEHTSQDVRAGFTADLKQGQSQEDQVAIDAAVNKFFSPIPGEEPMVARREPTSVDTSSNPLDSTLTEA